MIKQNSPLFLQLKMERPQLFAICISLLCFKDKKKKKDFEKLLVDFNTDLVYSVN